MDKDEYKNLANNRLLKVVMITEAGDKEAEWVTDTSGYDRKKFRKLGFVGAVTAKYPDSVYLNSPTGRSIFELNNGQPTIPSSLFLYEEVEYATEQDLEDSLNTEVTRWLNSR